jgi:beta-lactamase superfamily II metal-dependent hydrolase
MNCEIEFLPVGEASRAGDAIVVRYGNANAYELMLIDGGHEQTGTQIVEHLNTYFPGQSLQHVLLTHSDIDHASGLRTVLEQIPVANLWMKIPWLHAAEAAPLFADKGVSAAQLERDIKSNYDIITQLFEIASARRIAIYEPFQGSTVGPFRVLSPSLPQYVHLIPQFERTPLPDKAAIERAGFWISQETLFSRLAASAAKAVRRLIPDGWYQEQLRDGSVTSATNESSVVLYGSFDENRRILLTGDAGVNALTRAAAYADVAGLPLRQFSFVQIPHHGSRSNVGPTILDQIVGQVQSQDAPPFFTAFVSAPADDETHPRKIVTNAFTRRGGNVSATQGIKIIYYGGFPRRTGYSDLTPMPFVAQVEEYDS